MKSKKLISMLLVLSMLASLFAGAVPVFAADGDGERTQPAAMDIGYPTFKNVEQLESVFDLDSLSVSKAESDIMMKIYEQDLAAGGDSFYVDRILARPGVCNGNAGSNGNADGNTFLTRGRALYMYTSSPSVIGFGGSTAYHQPLTGNMYEITFYQNGSKISTSEKTANRVNYPSNWVSNYSVGSNMNVDVTKFISNENVAVTAMTLKNTSASDQTVTVRAASGFVSEASTVEIGGQQADEVVGTVSSPSNLTTITTRMTGSGFTVDSTGKQLERELTVPAGGSVELKVVMAFTTKELPGSTRDYVRFAELSNLEAIRAQKAEYNLYWAQNLPYIEVPNLAVQKAIMYRWWSERFNSLDANIPGYDYQYPITIEGVLGYNNAIVLTQPMHLQDTKWLRTPNLAYGQLLSVGNCSQSSAFLDNPGNRSNWNNHYGQYLGDAGLEAFNVIGGGAELAQNLAYYFGHDATGQLEHYGNHIAGRSLIAYRNNYMTGNDADTISMSVSGGGTWKAHGENAYVWAAANAAAELYAMVGDTEKAAYYGELADKIQADILELMWCDKDGKFETYAVSPSNSFAKHNPDNTHLVDLTESNNWNYFAVGLVPTDEASLEKYKTAFEDFSNGEEFPIFPMFTANQVDNRRASGSNNFSNINFTVQARAYEAAIRTYDRNQEYITDEMLAMMTEWMAWLIYPDSGDVRYPNNSEYYNIDGRTYSNYYRSWIYHNILGNYNYIFFEDMAGLTPRADDKLELFPIDFKYDHFMVNNARYHGHDLSVVWDDPADDKDYYEDLPEGYTLFIDGERAFTLKTLSHVIYDAAAGTMEFPDGEAEVTFKADGFSIPTALDTVITNERTVDMLATAGIHGLENVAEGAEVTASFTPASARAASWAEKHRADGSDSTSKAVNETKPDPQAVVDGTTVNMPFWGNYGSTNENDSLVLKLAEPTKIDMAALYFYNDRQNGGYAEPAKYSLEYWDGEGWKHMPNQSRYPAQPQANYNEVLFSEVTTDQVRVTFTDKDANYTAVTEIQLFAEGGERDETGGNTAPTVILKEDTTQAGNLHTAVKATVTDDGIPYDKDMTFAWTLVEKPEGAEAILSGANKTILNLSASMAGDYKLHFVVSDGELSAEDDITVTIKESASGGLGEDVAPDAAVESDYTSSWEKLSGINDPTFEPGSSNVGTGKGWGNWSQSVGSEHYVGYTWPSAVTIGGADVYWYDDGGGTQVPSNFRMQYMDASGNWKDVNISTPVASAVAKNKYNRIEFTPVTTTRLRFYVTVKSGAAANGIYRFKVYASVDIDKLDEVHMATTPGKIPTLPATVTGYTAEGDLISVPVTWETVTAEMVASDADVVVKGINASTGKMTKATIYVRSDFASATITDVAQTELTTEVGVMPTLPAKILVGYNDGAKDNQNVAVTWHLTEADVAKAGDFTFEGDVEGTDTKALLTLHVLANVDFDAAQPVIALIDAIGTVTLESKDAIEAAKAAYDALSAGAKSYVTNAAALTDAETAYNTLASIKNVEELIDKISDEVTLADADAINTAYTAYQALSRTNRNKVTNASKLTAARTTLQNMQAAKNVEDQINALGEITLESEAAIVAARNAYDKLTAARKAYVPNLAVLEAAEAELERLKDPDGSAAAAVEALIAAIGEVTGDSKDAIEAARAAYDALTPAQKALVPNATELFDAEIAYPDHVAAEAVDAMIAAIGEVGFDSGDAIHAARDAYNALTNVQKSYVKNYAELLAAETAYDALPAAPNPDKAAAQSAIAAIAAIGTVTADSGDAIAAARAAYDALSSAARSYVTNARTLVEAEIAYPNLVAAAEVEELIAAIGTVTADSGDAIEAARAAYNALTNSQKPLVRTYEVLAAAETAYKAISVTPDTDPIVAQSVVARINAIGEVTTDSREAIEAARAAYDALTPEQKAYVTNISALIDAEARYPELVAAAAAEEKIAAIGTVTADSKAAIDAARTTYDALTNREKALVDNYEVLKAAEAAFRALPAEPDPDQAAADAVCAQIDAMGEITRNSGDIIKAARAAYDALTPAQKALVTNVQALVDAENLYPDLVAADAVRAKIDAIGEVTKASGSAIDAARAAYDALTPAQKKKVSNYAVLEAAEAAYEALPEEPNADAAAAKAAIEKIAAIGTVTTASGAAIEAARDVYNGLTPAQKALVTNAQKLVDAENLYEDLTAAAAADAKIAAIGKVTKNSEGAIRAARAAYDKLTNTQKAHVTKLAELEAAEAAFKALPEDADPDEAAAAAVEKKIAAIGEVTVDDKAAIEAARKAYDALTRAQKALVGNADALLDAEARYADLAAIKAAEDAIAAIGEVSLDSKAAIEAARAAYEALSPAQKAEVANAGAIAAAEAAYARLEREAAAADELEKIKADALAQLDALAVSDCPVAAKALAEYRDAAGKAVEAADTAKAVQALLAQAETEMAKLGCLLSAFEDVDDGAWYHEAVEYMIAVGLMKGMDDTHFSPAGDLTRAQLVTILYRVEGEPEVKDAEGFADVAEGQWYTAAIEWAAANGIVNGVGHGKFNPNGKITREQIAAILYRYAAFKQYDTSASAALDTFADDEAVSDWAVEAMQWAVGAELINGLPKGEDTLLDPAGTATRAQAAAIVQRFLTGDFAG